MLCPASGALLEVSKSLLQRCLHPKNSCLIGSLGLKATLRQTLQVTFKDLRFYDIILHHMYNINEVITQGRG